MALLDRAAARSIRFWWRDDDAETTTPALDRLLQLAARNALPLALAVVPKRATAGLANRLAQEARVSVLQHGWSHRNHSPADERKMELGDHRTADAIAGDLQQGFDRLATLFPKQFLPVLVPPWNRIGNVAQSVRREIGLIGLSTFGPAPRDDANWVNTHLDIFVWKPERRSVERRKAYAVLALELERRLAGDTRPIGILTHHLVHAEESWDLLDDLFELMAKHPSVAWPTIGELFELGKP